MTEKPNPTRHAPYGKCKRCKREALQSWLDRHNGYCYECITSKDHVLNGYIKEGAEK